MILHFILIPLFVNLINANPEPCNYFHFAEITKCLEEYFKLGGYILNTHKPLPNHYQLEKMISTLQDKVEINANGTNELCNVVNNLSNCLKPINHCRTKAYYETVKYNTSAVINAVDGFIDYSLKLCKNVNIQFDVPRQINCFAMIVTEDFMRNKECIDVTTFYSMFEGKNKRIRRITDCMFSESISKCGPQTSKTIQFLYDAGQIKIRIPLAFP